MTAHASLPDVEDAKHDYQYPQCGEHGTLEGSDITNGSKMDASDTTTSASQSNVSLSVLEKSLTQEEQLAV